MILGETVSIISVFCDIFCAAQVVETVVVVRQSVMESHGVLVCRLFLIVLIVLFSSQSVEHEDAFCTSCSESGTKCFVGARGLGTIRIH